jgi:hypothetical protein
MRLAVAAKAAIPPALDTGARRSSSSLNCTPIRLMAARSTAHDQAKARTSTNGMNTSASARSDGSSLLARCSTNTVLSR